MPAAHWAGPWWPIFPMFWTLLWGAAIFLFVRARRDGWAPWVNGPARGRPGTPTSSAETILAERFARGEMTDDEYYQRLSVLREGRS